MAVALEDGGLYFLHPTPAGGNHTIAPLPAESGNSIGASSKAAPKPYLFNTSLSNPACTVINLDLLHARLGHSSLSKMQHTPCCKLFLNSTFTYKTCTLAKFHRLPFNNSTIVAKFPFQLIHMDL